MFSAPRVRCFWAVRPPAPSLAPLGELVRTLKRALAQLGLQVTWPGSETYHFTLAFLGEVDEARIGALVAHVKAQLHSAPLLNVPQVQLAGLGMFPGPQRPHVVFVEGRLPAPAPTLSALQAQLVDWLAEIGHPREERPFHPHLTIGRVRSAAPGSEPSREAALRELMQSHAAKSYGAPFSVDELILYESQLHPGGARYTPLSRLPLLTAALPRS